MEMEIKEEIMKVYSKESGIPICDNKKEFFREYSEWREKQAKISDEEEPERCPCCGQVI